MNSGDLVSETYPISEKIKHSVRIRMLAVGLVTIWISIKVSDCTQAPVRSCVELSGKIFGTERWISMMSHRHLLSACHARRYPVLSRVPKWPGRPCLHSEMLHYGWPGLERSKAGLQVIQKACNDLHRPASTCIGLHNSWSG